MWLSTSDLWLIDLFLQTANTDQRAAGSFLAPPQYTGLPFCRVMQLIDLCILDAGSLRYVAKFHTDLLMCMWSLLNSSQDLLVWSLRHFDILRTD